LKEHAIAAKLLGEAPTTQVVMLIDEIEGHLHPKWQRTEPPG
jgi:predicted ATP-binding protein involved in virulence